MISSRRDFYIMGGGAVAALTGLLFVAMSIHLSEILASRDVTQNVSIALSGMLFQLVFCGFMVPGVTLQEAGAVISVAGVIFATAYLRYGRPRNLADTIANAGIGFSSSLIGIVMMLGWAGALYLYAVVLGLTVVALVRLCWRLLTLALSGFECGLPAVFSGSEPKSLGGRHRWLQRHHSTAELHSLPAVDPESGKRALTASLRVAPRWSSPT